MYDIFYNIISHIWDNTLYSSSEQQYIYSGCISLIIIFSVWILDRITAIIISTAKGGK